MRRTAIALAAVGAALILSGCTAAAAESVATQPPASSSTPMSTSTTVTDLESCAAFDDVSTILQNARMGLSSGRMTQQEYDGWLRLATRVQDRIPTRGEGDVSDGIAAVKAAAPAIPLGTVAPPLIGGDEWNNAAPLAAACTAAGYVFVVESWTGG